MIEFEIMFKKIAQFFLWDHIVATLWTTAVILVVAILYGMGMNVFHLQTSIRLSTEAVDTIGSILTILGALSFFVFVLSYMLFRRRRLDGSMEKPKRNE